MHNIWSRLNAVFFASVFTLGVMSGLTTLSTYHLALDPSSPTFRSPKVELNEIYSLQHYRDRTDRAILRLDLEADLSPVFNWNVKQLFVFVVAEYSTPRNKINQVVIWDKIVTNKKQAKKIIFKKENVKYFLADQYNDLRNAEVKLKLMWDIMPVVGRLFMHSKGESSFQMPSTYIRAKK